MLVSNMAMLPYLEVSSPTGQQETIVLDKDSWTVGRLPEVNDIALLEDTAELITRRSHCRIVREDSHWWLIDNSTNGTRLRRGTRVVDLRDVPTRRLPLNTGDLIEIMGWQLQFQDPNRTQSLRSPTPTVASSVFNVSQQALFKIEQGQPIKLNLRPKALRMLDFMARRNLEHQNSPVLCTYSELIAHIWTDSQRHDRSAQEINALAREIRDTLQLPGCLETVKTQGYILHIHCIS